MTSWPTRVQIFVFAATDSIMAYQQSGWIQFIGAVLRG